MAICYAAIYDCAHSGDGYDDGYVSVMSAPLRDAADARARHVMLRDEEALIFCYYMMHERRYAADMMRVTLLLSFCR